MKMSKLTLFLLQFVTILFIFQTECFEFTEEELLKLQQMLHNTCVEETDVDTGILDAAIKGNITNDDKLKCYMKCLLIEVGAMDDDGEIDDEAFVSAFPEQYQEAVQNVVDKCKMTDVPDLCERSFLMNICALRLEPERYILI